MQYGYLPRTRVYRRGNCGCGGWSGLDTIWAGISPWGFLLCHILRGLVEGTARLTISGLQSKGDKKLRRHSYIFYFDFAIMLP
ncbi:MAG: hypothetical protein WHT84_00305 [Breznakiellaceae bacterium]